MEWLGGSGYKHIGLYIHGVEYVKKNGDVISGTCKSARSTGQIIL
jgi:hypothetical protein